MHRGIDFQAVNFVVNVDFPRSARSYTHRIGRTARGGANGTALSLVNKDDAREMEVLKEVQANQPALPPLEGDTQLENMGDPAAAAAAAAAASSSLRAQPTPLAFDLKELEGFRYRVEDVRRAVTKVAVKEARLAEIKQELLNSEALKAHFQANPHEFQVLRHDKGILPSHRVQEHLKHVPDYLLPEGMRVGVDPAAKKRKRRRRAGKKRAQGQGTDPQRRKDNDPLQHFATEEDEEDEEDGGGKRAKGGGAEEEEDAFESGDEADGAVPMEQRIYGENEKLGESTAGRVRWQKMHKKGKFSGKVHRTMKQKQMHYRANR